MREINASDEAGSEEKAIQFGLSVSSYSPLFAADNDIVENLEEGDKEKFFEEVEEWWDDLSIDERIEVLNLNETSGEDIVENLIFVDKHEEDMGQMEPIYEW